MLLRAPQFIVGGNWKSNGTTESIATLVDGLNAGAASVRCEVVCGAPFVYLPQTQATLGAPFEVAAQNCWEMGPGAYTGEVGAEMLKVRPAQRRRPHWRGVHARGARARSTEVPRARARSASASVLLFPPRASARAHGSPSGLGPASTLSDPSPSAPKADMREPHATTAAPARTRRILACRG